jgi:hypothetical protein
MELIKHFWYLIHVERMKETVTVEALTSQMTPMKTIRSTLVSDNLAVVLDILMLQDKHNIHVCTLSLNIKLICTRCETG